MRPVLRCISWVAALAVVLAPPAGGRTAVAESAFGRRITFDDHLTARRQTHFLSLLKLNWRFPMLIRGQDAQLQRLTPLDVIDWLLLSLEAERARIDVDEEVINALLQGRNIDEKKFEQALEKAKITHDQGRRAVATLVAIQHLATLEAEKDDVPASELIDFMDSVTERIRVMACLLGSSRLVDAKAPIDEAQITAHYEKYKDVFPGENDLRMGYQRDYRIVVEHVSFDAGALGDGQAGEQRAREIADRLIRELRDEFLKGAIGSDRFRVATREIREEGYFKQAAERIAADAGVKLEYGKTRPFEHSEALAVPGIGRSFRQKPDGKRVAFPHFIFHVQGVASYESNQVDPFMLALYEPGHAPAYTPGKGQAWARAYIYRVVEVLEPSPRGLDEVRDRVVEDVRFITAHQAAGKLARQLAQKAVSVGLLEAYNSDPTLRQRFGDTSAPEHIPAFTRRKLASEVEFMLGKVATQPVHINSLIGSDPAFADGCFELAGTVAEKAQQGVEAGSGKHQLRVIELPLSRRWAVVEWLETLPSPPRSRDDIVKAYEMLKYLRTDRHNRIWFSRKDIFRRTQYQAD